MQRKYEFIGCGKSISRMGVPIHWVTRAVDFRLRPKVHIKGLQGALQAVRSETEYFQCLSSTDGWAE
jgi:hypothetical protein